ncbi:MAG TPA: hypothetical protein VGF95_08970 [Solirubrobacteraceae bacterium]|jgi:hypothetical protein
MPVAGRAYKLLAQGLPLLEPVLDRLGDGALLIGGLSVTAWLTARPVDRPIRPTADVDLGIDRMALGLTGNKTLLTELLGNQGFKPGYGDEAFRFARKTPAGNFVVDLLVAPGASRSKPPIVEPGLPTLAAPGLAYALIRGPMQLQLTLVDEPPRTFRLRTVQLDAAFVLKGALVASGVRTRPDRLITDTVDAVMLASACAADKDAMSALAAHSRRSDVKSATGWLAKQLADKRSATARRVARHFDDPTAAQWAIEVASSFAAALHTQSNG